jgi:hypothetical protein
VSGNEIEVNLGYGKQWKQVNNIDCFEDKGKKWVTIYLVPNGTKFTISADYQIKVK